MAYARFDDRYDDHRKIKRALRREPAAVAMHAMAITYCNRHNTDGVVDVDWIDERLALMPYKTAQRKRVVEVLVDVGLFEVHDSETYIVHDFLDWNRSSEQRKALSEQGRRGGHAKAAGQSHRSGHGSSHGQSDGQSDGYGDGSSQSDSGGSSTPTPTPTPTPSQQASTANAVAVAAPPPLTDLNRQIEEVCQEFSDHVRTTHGVAESSREGLVVKGWRDACRSMLTVDDLTAEQIRYAGRWVCRHHYWKNRVRSMPRLRSEMPQIAKDIREQRDGGSVVRLGGRKESAGDLINEIHGGQAA